MDSELELNSEKESDVASAVEEVKSNIQRAKIQREKHLNNDVTLVAVSKLKPKKMILEAYESGVRDFGENYVNELLEKANDEEITTNCPDIRWHFIGHLQTKKINKLVTACPNLYMIHSVESTKMAESINRAVLRAPKGSPLKVMIQVNTGLEETKGGISITEQDLLEETATFITEQCKELELLGLMTIPSPGHNHELSPNPEYLGLIKHRDYLNSKLHISLKLSIGMSSDYEHAVSLGSDFVRVGEKIFGKRQVVPRISE